MGKQEMNAPPEPAFLTHWEPDKELSPIMRRGNQSGKVPEVDEKKLDQNSSSGVLLSVQDMSPHVIMGLQIGAGRIHQYKILSLLVGVQDMNGRVVKEFQMGGKPDQCTSKLLLGRQDMNAPVVADFHMRRRLDKISSPTLLMNASMVTELQLEEEVYQNNGTLGLHVCDWIMQVPVSAISSLSDFLEVQEGTATGMIVYKRRPKYSIKSTAKIGQSLNGIVSTRPASHTALREPTAEVDTGEHVARRRFTSILRKFEVLRRRFLHQQELGSMTKKRARHCDMTAGLLMMRKQEYYIFVEGVGHVPGLRVGDCFSYRYEIFLTGLHGQVQAGISYIPGCSEPSKRYYHGQSVACSVVASGDYATSTSNRRETLTFLGEGVRTEHQKADKANLAIINSFRMSLPVRVIRSYKTSASPSGRFYSYDGLYKVESFMKEMGPSGFQVYKFYMRRECGQPSARLHVVRLLRNLSLKPAEQEDLLTADISEGAEPVPVCVVNTVDVDCPDPFHYTSTVWHSHDFLKLPSPTSCKCTHGCQDNSCPCVAKNHGRELAYNLDGCLIQVLDIVFECGVFCRCGEKCLNKVSQKGLQRRLQIFKTVHKGWGVRSLDAIPRGSFVCELTGELITATTASERENDEYLFDLDFKRGSKVRCGDTSNTMTRVTSSEGDETGHFEYSTDYVIDARKYGNVARFINHSCDPNLFVQGVLFDHDDINRAHLMLFASDNILPFSEIAYDYAYELDSVLDRHGNVRERACHCGAIDCRKRLY